VRHQDGSTNSSVMLAIAISFATLAASATPLVVHHERVVEIATVNAAKGVTWTAKAQTRFASEAPGISKALCGVIGDWKSDVSTGAPSKRGYGVAARCGIVR
jgi:hypothetical protein